MLYKADLSDALLDGADLSAADLGKTKGLTESQLKQACGDSETKLPKYLREYQMRPCERQIDARRADRIEHFARSMSIFSHSH